MMARAKSARKSAVVLSGGGAYGAYEVGVLKALLQGHSPSTKGLPFDPEVVTGTSVGACNAAFLVAYDKEEPATVAHWLEEAWLSEIAASPVSGRNGVYRIRGVADPRTLLTGPLLDPIGMFNEAVADAAFFSRVFPDIMAGVARGQGPVLHRALDVINFSAMVETDPLRRTLRRIVPIHLVQESSKVISIATTDWELGQVAFHGKEDFTPELEHTAVIASAAVPGFFPPVELHGSPHVDGGVLMNTPLKPAIENQAEVLHVIYLDPELHRMKVSRVQGSLDTLHRMLTIMLAEKINADISKARAINEGLRVLEKKQTARGAPAADDYGIVAKFAGHVEQRRSAQRKYRPLEIHRYHPRDELGGLLGLLDFGRGPIESFIKRGYQDAVQHDCEESGCVLP